MDLTTALSVALPEIVLAGGGLVLLALGAFVGERYGRLIAALCAVLLCVSAALSAHNSYGIAFGGGYVSDAIAAYAKVAIYLMSAVALVLGAPWLPRVKNARFEYPILVVLAAVG